jgi:predicted small secreted protein
MKKVILAIVLILATLTAFNACERNDYKHPLAR